MRPLVTHCRERAQEHLTTATTMYCEMDMRFWLEQAEELIESRAIKCRSLRDEKFRNDPMYPSIDGQVRALLDNFDGDALGMWRTAGRVRLAWAQSSSSRIARN